MTHTSGFNISADLLLFHSLRLHIQYNILQDNRYRIGAADIFVYPYPKARKTEERAVLFYR